MPRIKPKTSTTSGKKTNPAKQGGAAQCIVGIGASAGGLEALQAFVRHLPDDSSMAYVIAQHLSPQHRSMMVELLARHTKLTVTLVKNNSVAEANVIYITPPDSDVYVEGNRLRLRKPQAAIGPKPSIDYFFTSLAKQLQDHAIGVIFSGTGSDGSHGMRAIKAAGGITIAQNPSSAKYDSMPQSAIRVGAADLILNPDEVAKQLSVIVCSPRPIIASRDSDEPVTAYQRILERLYEKEQVNFLDYKEATLHRQLERRLIALQLDSLDAYLSHVQRNPNELNQLLRRFLISVTSFFRDAAYFTALRGILGKIIQANAATKRIRIWVPGCASGEEPYSIAILLAEELGRTIADYDITIFATDIDAEATDQGRRGLYPETALDGVDSELLAKYFEVQGRGYLVKKFLRELIVFARHDLIQDPPFVQVDLVSCRNLLIYFKNDLQNKVFAIFHYALAQDGYLFLGKSETVAQRKELFVSVDTKHRIYRRKAALTPRYNLPKPLLFRTPTIEAAPKKPKQQSFDHYARQLLTLYAPATALVNQEGNCIRYLTDFSAYLTAPAGSPTTHLPSTVLPPLRTEVRVLLHRAKTQNEPVNGPFQHIEGRDDNFRVRTLVRPAGVNEEGEALFFVSFEQQVVSAETNSVTADTTDTPEGSQRLVTTLQEELTQNKQHLQSVIEEMESSNEELQSLNEEMQASTEELQASNEQLETTNEELQASNEELSTLNEELQIKSNELNELNATLENLQDSTDIALMMVDEQHRVVRYTPKATSIFTIVASDIGRPIHHLPTRIKLPYLKRKLTKTIKSGTVQREQREGHKVTYMLQITPYRDSLGHVTGAVLAFTDVTELHTALKQNTQLASELRTALHFRETLLNAAPIGIIGFDTDGSIKLMSAGAESLLGYRVDEIINRKDILSLWHDPKEVNAYLAQWQQRWELSLSSLEDWLQELARRGLNAEKEWLYRRKDGSYFPAFTTVSVLRDQQGNVTGLLKIIHDLSAQRAAEAELRQASAQFEVIFQAMPEVVLFTNLERQIVLTNPALKQVFGYAPTDLLGQSSECLYADATVYQTLTHERSEKEGGLLISTPFEAEYRRKDGVTFIGETVSVVVKDSRAELLGYLELVRDVTPRKQAERALYQHAQTLKQRNADLQQFAYVASHDLQEPLRMIAGHLQLLDKRYREQLDEKAQNYIHFAVDGAQRMQALINGLLAYSRIETQAAPFKPVSLAATLTQVSADLQRQIDETAATISYDELPSVCGDEIQCRQLLQNLISNALKFRGSEPPRIHLSARTEKGHWVIGVSDNGIGIKLEYHRRIFQIFQRLHTRQEYTGEGLGLAICQRIVEHHGGQMWLESEYGIGTTFFFTLPRCPSSYITHEMTNREQSHH
jgi:two-component system CheB/CheR fusion protein